MSSYNVNGVILSPAISGSVITPSQYNNKVLALQQILDLATQLENNIGQCTSQFSVMQNAINSLTTVTTGQYITADLVNALINAINAVYDYEECLISYYNSIGTYPSVPSIMTVSPVTKGQIIIAYSWNNWNQDIFNEFVTLTRLPFLFTGSESIGFVSPSPSISKKTEVVGDIFAGYYTDPAYIAKISPDTMSLIKFFTAPLTHGYVNALTSLSGYIYAGYSVEPGYVDKISPANMKPIRSFTPPSGHNDILALTALSGYVYVGYSTSPGYIDKISPDTMTLVKTFTSSSEHSDIKALTSLSGDVFAGYHIAPGVVARISTDTMSLIKIFYRVSQTRISLFIDVVIGLRLRRILYISGIR